jgi:hypothetical protein
MQHDHLEPTRDRVGDMVKLVKDRPSRLCHDDAIEAGNAKLAR